MTAVTRVFLAPRVFHSRGGGGGGCGERGWEGWFFSAPRHKIHGLSQIKIRFNAQVTVAASLCKNATYEMTRPARVSLYRFSSLSFLPPLARARDNDNRGTGFTVETLPNVTAITRRSRSNFAGAVHSTLIQHSSEAERDARRRSAAAELKFVSLLRVALLNAIYEIPPRHSSPRSLGPVPSRIFPYARRRADRDGKRERDAREHAYRRCSSDVS